MLDGYRVDIVAPAGRTVRVNQVLGHQEQADAFNSRRCVGQTGQNQVEDIVREVVISPGYEYFRPDNR